MSKNKSSGSDLKQEDVLQAVVLADSFDFRFSPITRSAPRVLKTYFYLIFSLYFYTYSWFPTFAFFATCCEYIELLSTFFILLFCLKTYVIVINNVLKNGYMLTFYHNVTVC